LEHISSVLEGRMILRHKGIVAIFILVILFSIIWTPSNLSIMISQSSDKTHQRTISALSYENHEPIRIENNSQLISIAAAEDWNGTGTVLDPYVIQGFNITKNSSHLIWISNVNLSLSILDCVLRSNDMIDPWAGIYLESCENVFIANCRISNLTKGIYIDKSKQVVVDTCRVFDCGERGMQIWASSFCWVKYCDVYGSDEFGISLWGSNHIYLDNNIVHDNNYSGIGIGTCSFCTITNSTLWRNGRSDFAEIYGLNLANTHDMLISNLTIFDSYYGIHIGDSANNLVTDCNFSECVEGVYFSWSNATTLRNSIIQGSPYRGVRLRFSDDCIIEGNLITNNTIEGIDIYQSDNCSIRGNIVSENGWVNDTFTASGMLIGSSHECLVEDNLLYNNSNHGIDLTLSENCTIRNNEIHEHLDIDSESCGVHIHESDRATLQDNTIFDNYIGIQDFRSDLCNLTGNVVNNNNFHGIQVNESENCFVFDNLVYDTISTGIYLVQTNACRIIANDIGWNEQNAIETDSIGSNHWNDGSIGNWWSDWTGIGFYSIYNTSDGIQNDDMHPAKSLDLENKTAVQLEISDLRLDWTASAKNPDTFEVLIDGTSTQLEIWNGSNLNINLEGIHVGVYNATLTIYHYSGHHMSSSLNLTIFDATPPEFTTIPEDLTLVYGVSLYYQLNATDPSGVSNWYVNDTSHFRIVNGLLTNITTLDVGSYVLNISVSDIYGNTRSKTVRIFVTQVSDRCTTCDNRQEKILMD
jgi:parallel beta-helix repeat protein